MTGVQRQYAPNSICFGCGPANAKGLRIDSRKEGDALVCDWTPEPHHAAFPGVMNGGIVGALLDCHSNWCAAMTLMERRGETERSEAPTRPAGALSAVPPVCVTAEFHVKLRRPTPMSAVRIIAKTVEVEGDKVTVEAELRSGDKVTATCRGVFVAVKEGHPAYHRWS